MQTSNLGFPLLLLAATALIAATPAADLDQNGEVSRAEFMAAEEARFTAADKDFDGQLTREEMQTLRENERTEHARKHFARMDANGDGVVSEAEMLAIQSERMDRHGEHREDRRAAMLDRFDSDGDGVLSEAERATAREARMGKRVKDRFKTKRRKAKRPRLDADGDGLISRAEYDAMGEALFTRMDANGDGVLTQGEGRRPKGPPPRP